MSVESRHLLVFLSVVMLVLFWFTVRNRFKLLNALTPVWYILFLVGGFLNTQIRDTTYELNSAKRYYLEILERPIEKQRSFSAKAKILSNEELSFGRVYAVVYFEKVPNVKALLPGDRIEVSSMPSEIEGPKNPKEFDYKGYLELLNIHSRFYLKQEDWILVKEGNGLKRISSKIQFYFSGIIKKFGFPEEETEVLQALLIGNRMELSDELTANYASAGAMHVLAVSGLHVGILMLVLLNISKPLLLFKQGKYIQGTIVLAGIWSYAFITGLSPSVMRASTMFTFIYLGRFGKRDISIYNGLLASAFFLLLLEPNLIFQVGFQLSYAAVLGILYLQPKLYNLITKPKNVILEKAWAITCVSFAAQIATFPFSIYYFHQFPLLFLFSNLIVILVTYLIMVIGLLFLLLGSLGVFIPVLFNPLHYLVWIMNHSVQLIHDIPNSVVYELSIERFELVLLYLIIASMSIGLAQKEFIFLSGSLLCLLTLSIFNIWENKRLEQTSEVTFYSVRSNTAIELRNGREAVLLADSAFLSNASKMQFHVLHNLWSQNLKSVEHVQIESENTLGANYVQRNKTIFLNGIDLRILDKKDHQLKLTRKDIVLLKANQEVLEGAKQVIVTSQVSASVKEKWEQHYQDAFVDLEEGSLSFQLKK